MSQLRPDIDKIMRGTVGRELSEKRSKKWYRCKFCDKYYTHQYSLMDAGHSNHPHVPQCRSSNDVWMDISEWPSDVVKAVAKQRRRGTRNFWKSVENQQKGQQEQELLPEEGVAGADIAEEPCVVITQQSKASREVHKEHSSGQKAKGLTEGQKLKEFQHMYNRLKAISDGIDGRLERALQDNNTEDYLSGLLRKVQRPRVLPMLMSKFAVPVFPGTSIPTEILVKWKLEGGLSDNQIDMIVADLTGKKSQSYKIPEVVQSYVDFAEIGPEPGQELYLKNNKIIRYIKNYNTMNFTLLILKQYDQLDSCIAKHRKCCTMHSRSSRRSSRSKKDWQKVWTFG